jgi:hypothetical protein
MPPPQPGLAEMVELILEVVEEVAITIQLPKTAAMAAAVLLSFVTPCNFL